MNPSRIFQESFRKIHKIIHKESGKGFLEAHGDTSHGMEEEEEEERRGTHQMKQMQIESR